jgi:hypothetical protein
VGQEVANPFADGTPALELVEGQPHSGQTSPKQLVDGCHW